MERLSSDPDPIVVKLLDAGLVGDRRIGVGFGFGRLGGIFSPLSVHVVHPLCFEVVGSHIGVSDRPGGGYAAAVPYLAEVALPHPQEGRAIELGIASDVVVDAGMEL